MNNPNNLSASQAAEFERELTLYYGEPVRPVSQYCDAFRDWFKALKDKFEREDSGDEYLPDFRDEALREVIEAARGLELPIYKSSMLYRRIYMGERLRTEMCPTHKGRWVGLPSLGNECECDLTGWLPADPNPPWPSPIQLVTLTIPDPPDPLDDSAPCRCVYPDKCACEKPHKHNFQRDSRGDPSCVDCGVLEATEPDAEEWDGMDALESAWAAWRNYIRSGAPIDEAHALGNLNDAMSDLITWSPNYNSDIGDLDNYDEE